MQVCSEHPGSVGNPFKSSMDLNDTMHTFQVGGLSHSFTASRSSLRLPHLHGPTKSIQTRGLYLCSSSAGHGGPPQLDMMSSQQQYLASKSLCKAAVVMMGIRERDFAKKARMWSGSSHLATNRRFHRMLPATAVLK